MSFLKKKGKKKETLKINKGTNKIWSKQSSEMVKIMAKISDNENEQKKKNQKYQ